MTDKPNRLNKIDKAGLGSLVMNLAGQSHSCRDIADILQREHGMSITYDTVAKYIQRQAGKNGERVREKLDEQIDRNFGDIIDKLAELYRLQMEIANNQETSDRDRINAADKARLVLETFKKFTGGETTVEISTGETVRFIHVVEQKRSDAHSTGESV